MLDDVAVFLVGLHEEAVFLFVCRLLLFVCVAKALHMFGVSVARVHTHDYVSSPNCACALFQASAF